MRLLFKCFPVSITYIFKHFALAFGAGGAFGFGCASSGEKPNLNPGFDIIENTATKRTKVNVGTGLGENTQMVLVEEPGGGKWIEDNAGAVVYRWDPASMGWRPTSNPTMPLELNITPFVEEKFGWWTSLKSHEQEKE